MSGFNRIFLSISLFASLLALPVMAQNDGGGAGKKPAAAAKKPAAKETQTAPLTPEVVHRIETEIRSRYSVPPQITITLAPPKVGDMAGYDDVVVTFSGGTHTTNHTFLISKDRKTLAHLETIDISQDIMSKIDVKGRPVKGNPEAKVTIVNYDDFQCPYCSRTHATLAGLVKDYGDRVRMIYKDYPLVEIHPWAMHAAIVGNCLGDQNGPAYWDFADYVHANQRQIAGRSRVEAFANLDSAAKEQAQKHSLDQGKLEACTQKQDETAIRASMAEGDKLGVDSTPTMFINGERFTGVIPEQELRAAIDRALAESGQQAPTNAKK